MEIDQHIHGIPDLFEPAAEADALLVPEGCVLEAAEALVGLSQVEMGAAIGGIGCEVGEEQALVPLEFVGLTAAVIAIIDPQGGGLEWCDCRAVPVFVCGADTGPRDIETKEAGVRLFEGAGALNELVAWGCQRGWREFA